jgi:hypothetical protein
MIQSLVVALVLSGSAARVEIADQRAGLLAAAEDVLGLPPLEWGMALVAFKERARETNRADALSPCRPDGEVCRLTVVREYVERGPGELASLKTLFAERDKKAWAAVGALRLGPVAELVFDRSTARLIGLKLMQVRELSAVEDPLTTAQLVPGTWSLSPRAGDAVVAAGAEEGTVRFVVSPWANVSCGGWLVGQTPFEERRLPAGTYECEVSNPELGATERVHLEVRANRRSVVRVRLE